MRWEFMPRHPPYISANQAPPSQWCHARTHARTQTSSWLISSFDLIGKWKITSSKSVRIAKGTECRLSTVPRSSQRHLDKECAHIYLLPETKVGLFISAVSRKGRNSGFPSDGLGTFDNIGERRDRSAKTNSFLTQTIFYDTGRIQPYPIMRHSYGSTAPFPSA